MKKLIFGVLFFVFTIPMVNAQENAYSLQQAIDYALENSDRLKNAKLDVQAALKEIGKIRASGLPQINAGLGLNYNYEIRKSILPAATFDATAPEDVELILAFGTKYDGDANIGLSQLLFDGSYFVGLQAAKMYQIYSEQELEMSKVEVIEQVIKSYYVILISEVRYDRAKSNDERLSKLLDETTVMYESGFAEKIDVSRIRVQYNNNKVQLNQFERLTDYAKLFLKVQMGLDLEQDITLTAKLQDLPDLLKESVDFSEFTYEDRPDYQLLNSGRKLQELDIKNYKVQYYPNLYLNGVYGRNTNAVDITQYTDLQSRWLSYGVLGVKLNVPIFDGLRKSYSIQKSKIELEKIDNQKALLEKNISTEIVQKRNNLANSLELMEAQKQNYDLAEEIFETTNIKYQEGIGSNLEVVEANNSLIDAQVIYFDALYNAVIARVELEKALGLYNDL